MTTVMREGRGHLHRRPVVASRRGRTRETKTEGGGVEVDDDDSEVDDDKLEEEDDDSVLQVRDEAAVCSEARVEVATCSEAGDEAAVCSGSGIEDDKRWRHKGV
jgi:hypothetical protein